MLPLQRGPPAKRYTLPHNNSSSSINHQLDVMCLPEEDHKECPVYFHWFALKLYDLYAQVDAVLEANTEDVELKLLDEEYHINRKSIQLCAETLRFLNEEIHLMKVGREVVGIASCPEICNAEITYTSIFA